MIEQFEFGIAALLASAAICFGLLLLLYPLLAGYALAKPNARSSHLTPTPQGGGIAVLGATTLVLAGAVFFGASNFQNPFALSLVFFCAVALAGVGAIDDIRPLQPTLRLALQTAAVIILVVALPSALRIFSALPWWIERTLLFVALLWFINLVNFMDGIDWMTVAEVVPVTAGLALFGLMGALPRDATLVAFALCGAMIGFAPFNRPVAKLFLGDVGSLSIGLLVGWLLIVLAGEGHLLAALLLPLYYLADATLTLLRRLVNGENILHAHRSHFYQRAMDKGYSVNQIVGSVFVINIILCGLAAITVISPSIPLRGLAAIIAGVMVGSLLLKFNGMRLVG